LLGTTVLVNGNAQGSSGCWGRHSQTVPALAAAPFAVVAAAAEDGRADPEAITARPIMAALTAATNLSRRREEDAQPGCIPIQLQQVPRESNANYRFGDLLALARLSWVSQMAAQLAEMGYHDYRRSDAAVMRLLQRGPMPIGRVGQAIGVTRQAARKIVNGLELRGFATTSRDESDSRQINVLLTNDGARYANAVVVAIERLNSELSARVDPADLAAAESVLRTVIAHSRSHPRPDTR
jgi:DNA-binding MarR family transcriptional regulator